MTSDGKTLKYDEDRQVIYRTAYLPITAKTELMRNTSKLPEYLRPIITEMSGDAAALTTIVAEQKAVKEEKDEQSAATKLIATPATKPPRKRIPAKKKDD